jgi:hypothetical protein
MAKDKKDKKPFGETKVGAFLGKVKDKLPDLAGDVVDVIASPNPGAALVEKLVPKLKTHKNPVSNELLMEFKSKEMEFIKEMHSLDVQDRDSARNRQVEMAKAGKTDWFMYVVGSAVLGLVGYVVYYIFNKELKNAELAHFIAGEVIGLGTSLVFFYYGSSQSSRDKDDRLSNL